MKALRNTARIGDALLQCRDRSPTFQTGPMHRARRGCGKERIIRSELKCQAKCSTHASTIWRARSSTGKNVVIIVLANLVLNLAWILMDSPLRQVDMLQLQRGNRAVAATGEHGQAIKARLRSSISVFVGITPST